MAVLVGVCLCVSTPVVAEPEEFVIVVSPDVPVSDISLEELKNIFMFRKQFWSAGQPITIIISDDDLSSDSFLLQDVYRMEYKYWKRFVFEKLYQGQIDLAPKIVASGNTKVSFVASGKGLLALTDTERAGEADVKILSIDGKAPGSPGYPLRR